MAADASAMNRAHARHIRVFSLDSSSGSSGVSFCCLHELLALNMRLQDRIGGSWGRDDADYAIENFWGAE